jgi:hypothetical protein
MLDAREQALEAKRESQLASTGGVGRPCSRLSGVPPGSDRAISRRPTDHPLLIRKAGDGIRRRDEARAVACSAMAPAPDSLLEQTIGDAFVAYGNGRRAGALRGLSPMRGRHHRASPTDRDVSRY